MDNKTSVSSSRFWLVCHKFIIEHKKNIIYLCAGVLVCCLALGILFGLTGNMPLEGTFIFYVFMSGLLCSVAASRMFMETVRKEGSVSLLMTPASNRTKFIMRLICVLPCMVLICVIGYIIFGYTAILTMGIQSGNWFSLYLPPMTSEYSLQSLFLLISVFLFTDSLFMFGAVSWPKRSFPKTLCLLTLLLIIFAWLVWLFIKIISNTSVYVVVTDEKAFTWSVISVITVVAALITVWTYYRFKNKTIA